MTNVETVVGSRNPRSDDESGVTELRVETVRMLVLAILVVGYLVVMGTVLTLPASPTLPPSDPLALLAGLAITAGLTRWALRRGPGWATAIMVAGLCLTMSGDILLHPGSSLATFFFLIVLAATGAGGLRAGLGAALLATGAIFSTTDLVVGVTPPAVAEQSLQLVWATFVLAWLLVRPVQTTLEWSWRSYALAQARTAEARQRQAELAEVSTSLAEACEQLERVNRELFEAREAAEAARRMKAEFAATVGHELRTPVNLIIGFSQMMASPRRATYYTEPLPESYRSDIQSVFHNACHISSLVDDILDLSQIDAHRMALHREPTALARVAEEAVSNVAPLYAEAGLSLSIDMPAKLPRFPADPVRIRQVLINLLYNAVRFTHQGGVVISAHLTDHDAIVSVRDTGVGIPAEGITHLFEEFRQLQAPSRGHIGSGLGLAVCKRFVELHGGTIWADSEPDRGTTISFALPLHDNVAAVPFSSLPSPVGLADPLAGNVAILDPSGETVRMLQRYLDDYRVRHLRQVGEASHLAKRGELRAMIVTSAAAQQDWYDYQRTHEDVRLVPTIVYALRTREAIAKVLGATEYLAKPVSREQLARAVRRLPRPTRNLAVIEDDSEMRSLLVRMLRSLSRRYRIEEAGDGVAGLDLIRRSRPDAVLLDLLMPNTDGYAVIRALREDESLRDIPVVVISARGPRIVLATMMLPYEVTMIPLFVIFTKLHWLNTYWPMVLPAYLGNAFFIFLLRQFFLTIPPELADAARVDGARELDIFWRVVLPLATPALATVALFSFMNTYTDFLSPLIYLNNDKLWTLSLGMDGYLGRLGAKWNILMAGSVLFTLPMVILFFLTQRVFIQGITMSGLKG
ncbi:MAG: ATP-binding protein [Chloroflexota bacterium]